MVEGEDRDSHARRFKVHEHRCGQLRAERGNRVDVPRDLGGIEALEVSGIQPGDMLCRKAPIHAGRKRDQLVRMNRRHAVLRELTVAERPQPDQPRPLTQSASCEMKSQAFR